MIATTGTIEVTGASRTRWDTIPQTMTFTRKGVNYCFTKSGGW